MFAIVPRGEREWNVCVYVMSWKGKLYFSATDGENHYLNRGRETFLTNKK